MKVKLLNILTVCCIALVFLAPDIAVCGAVWEKHLELTQSDNLVFPPSQSSEVYADTVPELVNDTAIFTYSYLNSSEQLLNQTQQKQIARMLLWFFSFMPIGTWIGIIMYDKYQAYRTAVYRRQVELLERMWQQSIYP